jgi:hypothetical protein
VRVSYGGKHRGGEPIETIEFASVVRNGRMLRVYKLRRV